MQSHEVGKSGYWMTRRKLVGPLLRRKHTAINIEIYRTDRSIIFLGSGLRW